MSKITYKTKDKILESFDAIMLVISHGGGMGGACYDRIGKEVVSYGSSITSTITYINGEYENVNNNVIATKKKVRVYKCVDRQDRIKYYYVKPCNELIAIDYNSKDREVLPKTANKIEMGLSLT